MSHAPCHVLLVEDDDDNATFVVNFLGENGVRVTRARSVQAARLYLAAVPYDLVISDIGLPGESGWDLMTKARPANGVPAIALSGYARKEDEAKSRAAGFLAHLSKPVNLDELLEAVTRYGCPAERS